MTFSVIWHLHVREINWGKILLMTNRNDCSGVPDGAWLIGVNVGATRGEAARFTGLCDKHITNHGFIFIHIFKPFVTAPYD